MPRRMWLRGFSLAIGITFDINDELTIAVDMGITHLKIKLDSLVIVQLLKSNISSYAFLNLILDESM